MFTKNKGSPSSRVRSEPSRLTNSKYLDESNHDLRSNNHYTPNQFEDYEEDFDINQPYKLFPTNTSTSSVLSEQPTYLSSIVENHRQIIELEFLSPEQTGHREPDSILKERFRQAGILESNKDVLSCVTLLTKWGYIATELESHLINHFPATNSLLTLEERMYFLNEIQVKVVEYFIDTARDINNMYCYGCISGISVNVTNIINDLYQLKIARMKKNTNLDDLRVYNKKPPPRR
ncbi:NAD-reducing hydrogenase HoxS subunit beta [Acrasis kona]|uniref:NAD-reducing hydrogenase HoxS subunit beta n=1 Tax=Acrasis kona TaxID=1008807 RepID=A0AAW2ZC31_9EUKA